MGKQYTLQAQGGTRKYKEAQVGKEKQQGQEVSTDEKVQETGQKEQSQSKAGITEEEAEKQKSVAVRVLPPEERLQKRADFVLGVKNSNEYQAVVEAQSWKTRHRKKLETP